MNLKKKNSYAPQLHVTADKREIYVREAVERGLADSKAGRTKDVKEVRAKLWVL